MVKLQKRFAYQYKETKHYKHIVTIPEEFIQKLGWDKDIDLQPVIRGDKLIFKRKVAK